MGHAARRQRSRDGHGRGLRGRRRVLVRPPDLRDYCPLLGNRLLGADQGNNPISLALNTRPKYVASTTFSDPQWADTTVLSGEVAVAIGEPKARPGREMQVHGCGALVRWLLDNDL